MRILLLSLNYHPELTGIGKYSGEMAAWLAARGHSIRVITAPPYYPEWRIHKGYSGHRYTTEELDGVDVLRCPLWVPRRQSGAARILNLASFALSSAPVVIGTAIRFRPDVIGVVKPPMFALPTALLAARITGAKAWVHVQDFDIDVAFDMGLLKSRYIGRTALRLDAALLRRFDLATTISARMRERLIDKGVAEAKAALFPNWVDTEAIHPEGNGRSFRKELGIAAGTTVALYAGNLGEKQGLDTLLGAARILSCEPTILFVIAGDGAVRKRLESAAVGLGNVKFLPLQPADRLNDLLSLADIHLLPQRSDAADLVMPSKLSGMLASGRPVVAGAKPGTQVAAEVAGAGLVVPPDDEVSMASAVRRLAFDRAECVRLGAEARVRAISRWERDAVLTRLEEMLVRMAGSTRVRTAIPDQQR